MGGMGSGEYSRSKQRKVCVEECFSIDSFDLARESRKELSSDIYFNFDFGEQYEISVSVRPQNKSYGIWAVLIDKNLDKMQLWTSIHAMSNEIRSEIFYGADQCWKQGNRFSLEFAEFFAPQATKTEVTVSPAGSKCSWFLCPKVKAGTVCSRRCRKLYWSNGKFACRQCQGLAYTSQRKDVSNRLFDKAEKIREMVLEQLDEEERLECANCPWTFPPPAPHMTFKIHTALHLKWFSYRVKAMNLMIAPIKRYSSQMNKDEDLEFYK